MKSAIALAALPLACASAPPAFVYPAASTSSCLFATNRPKREGDVSLFSSIPPIRLQKQHQTLQRKRRWRQEGQHGRSTVVASLGGSVSSFAGAVVSSTSVVLSWSPTAFAALVGALAGASLINALQGGIRGDLGTTPDKILGVPAEKATAEDVAKLDKAGFMQLFYSSTCPEAEDLDGEYRARTLEMGILHPITAIITHRIWGPGRWLGKGIRSGSSEGYNLFSPKTRDSPVPPSEGSPSSLSSSSSSSPSFEEDGIPSDVLRDRAFRFSPYSESVFDRGASSTLNYGKAGNNGPLFGGMRDEVRKVNDRLFVGLGYIKAFGGKYNTAPFVMEGPPVQKFSQGPDRK